MKLKEIINFFNKYFKEDKKGIVIVILLILIGSITGLSFGYFMGVAIDYTSKEMFREGIITLSILLGIGLLEILVIERYKKILANKISLQAIKRVDYLIFHKVGLLPARAFEEKSSGELINIIMGDASTIAATFKSMLGIVISLLASLVVFIYVCFNSYIIAIEIIIYLIIFALISHKYLPTIKKNEEEITIERDKIMLEVNESIRGIREIRALGIRDKVNKNVNNIIDMIFNKLNKQNIDETNYYSVIMMIGDLLEGISFITCIILINKGMIPFSFFMTLTYYIYRFMNTVDDMMAFSSSYEKMGVAIKRIENIIDNKEYSDMVYGNYNNKDIKGIIEFKDVTFKYSNEEKYIFKDFNLVINNNQKIAIVGKSGQGKSTIFNLILRYFEPTNGEILLDNVPLKDYSEKSFNKNIAIIRQEPFLFNKTLLENFKIVDNKLSLSKIRYACKISEIDDYIMSLPNKYDTLIGEGGVNLSGGQKQRIAIARALLKESKIILFDEATSALDNESQEKIKRVINKLAKDHTIIMVAHRLSTIIDADVIHLIDKGKIIASGTHEELLKSNKLYQELYKKK